MGKISKKVSKGLSSAIKEAQSKMTGKAITNINAPENIQDNAEALLNSGAEAQKKRKRRTKAEIEATKQENNSLFESLHIPKEEDNRPEWEKRPASSHEEFCEWKLQMAKLKGLEEPDFDFRNYYKEGQEIFYIHILRGWFQTKEIKKLKIHTVYPRLLICSEAKANCQCIGYKNKDLIFQTLKDANAVYKKIKLKEENLDGKENKPEEENLDEKYEEE